MRRNLILHFHCSECGRRLELTTQGERTAEPVGADKKEDDEPTGADCFYPPVISVRPCRYCIEKHTGPAEQLLKALKELIKTEDAG